MTQGWDDRTDAAPGAFDEKSLELDIERFLEEHTNDASDAEPSALEGSVLVFEPQPVGLAEAIAACGYDVRVGASGVDVMALVAEEEPALLLCGPTADAERRRLLAAAIRLRFPAIPILYASGHAGHQGAILGAAREGARGLIPWPLPSDDVVRRAFSPYLAPTRGGKRPTESARYDKTAATKPRATLASPPSGPPQPARAVPPPLVSRSPVPERPFPRTDVAVPATLDRVETEDEPPRALPSDAVRPFAHVASTGASDGDSAARTAPQDVRALRERAALQAPQPPPDDDDVPTLNTPQPRPPPPRPRPVSTSRSAAAEPTAPARQKAQVPPPLPKAPQLMVPPPVALDASDALTVAGSPASPLPRRGEIGALLAAVSPFLWSLEDAARWAKALGEDGDPTAASHARTLTLLAKILEQLQARIDEMGA